MKDEGRNQNDQAIGYGLCAIGMNNLVNLCQSVAKNVLRVLRVFRGSLLRVLRG